MPPPSGVHLQTPEIGVAPIASTRDSGTMATAGIWTRVRRAEPVDFWLTGIFALVFIVQIARHEMWRDEIHSWGLVLASHSLVDLYANLRFTGHPGLWYLLLWLASEFTASPYTVQVVHAAIALLLIGLIGLGSPFSRLERLLLLSSYFVLYEYTVISRNYGLGLLIALAYAQSRATRPDRLYLNAALLGLLANTNLFAFVLSGALACEYLLALLLRPARPVAETLREVAPAALLYLIPVALAVATMWPSPDISWRTTGAPLGHVFDLSWLVDTIAGNVAALLPLHPLSYWNSFAQGTVRSGEAALVLPLGILLFYMFKASPRLLLIPGLTAFGSIAIGHLVYANSIRHWGINFVAFVAAFWIYRVQHSERSWPALALLAVNAIAGIAISVQQFPLVFSEGEATAQWIRANGLADDALVGTPDTLTAVVAQYLGKPIYFLDCSCTDTYLFYNKRRDAYDSKQIPERLARAVEELKDRRILLLISRPLRKTELSALRDRAIDATQLAAFDHASIDEDFFVYRINRPPN